MNLIVPVQAPITAAFGIWPDDPVAQQAYRDLHLKGHDGIDYGAPFGTPAKAAIDATVRLVEQYGVYLTFAWRDGQLYEMVYAHCSQILVKVGQRVKQGDIIVKTGNEGGKFAPHLHFGVRKLGDGNLPNDGYYHFIDPAPFLQEDTMITSLDLAKAVYAVLGGDNPNPPLAILKQKADFIDAHGAEGFKTFMTDVRTVEDWIRLVEHPELDASRASKYLKIEDIVKE